MYLNVKYLKGGITWSVGFMNLPDLVVLVERLPILKAKLQQNLMVLIYI